ncbi:ribonuclease P protein component [Gordonia polyisoprenivorans]|uniref:ribonuclease P protein component n=1 Tax=Gordonia polyisoprenivorans TaxID=84595 RepID=UPI001AD7B399|nr:ribonuclease P protein component [Gordonia polyisoprenivorans]QTI69531.1 ribonuclease P protein component [Gordonia polyisoprenivorans]
MMSAQHGISRGSDFSRTLKRGVRTSTRDLVVSVAVVPSVWPDPSGRRTQVAMTGGPWLGLIVSKSVGPAVVRHRVARRLRAAFRDSRVRVPATETFVVVRALPGAAHRSSDELADQLREVMGRKRVRELAARSAEVQVAGTGVSA